MIAVEIMFSADIPDILSGAIFCSNYGHVGAEAPFLKSVIKNFHLFFPTPALPVSGSMGLISAVIPVITAPQYNENNITLFWEISSVF